MNDEVRVEVPDDPLDTSDPMVAKALLGLLRRFVEINRSSTPPFTSGGNRERDLSAVLPADPGSPVALRAVADEGAAG